MSRTKKIAILAIVIMVLTLMPTAMFAATADSTRLEGANRIATALDIASAGTWGTTVVLAPANDANLVDALAAAPLAGQENAPILLTNVDSLNADVKAKITALGATKVYVVGAISDAVAAEVDAISGVTVEALKGANRIATAAAVNAKLTAPAGTFVVGYNAVPDALSVASYAAKNKFAIVLANANGSVDASALVGATKYIIGGPTLVADIAGAERIFGVNRYATNTAVAEKLGFSYDTVYVANGVSLVDALAVAPLAAKANAFVALASATDVAASSVVNAKLTASSKVIAVGGTGVVSSAVVGKVAYAAPATLAVESVSAINAAQLQITFNSQIDKDTIIDANDTLKDDTTITVVRVTGTGSVTVDTLSRATLSSDAKTLTITATGGAFHNLQFNVVIAGNIIKDLGGKKLAKYVSTTMNVKDETAPTIANTVVRNATTVRVNFSEPMQTAGAWSFKFANGDAVTVGIDSANLYKGYVDLQITDAAADVGKAITATVIGASDYAGNLLTPNPSTLTISKGSKDGVRPEVQAITAKDVNKFEVVWTEEVLNFAIGMVTVNGSAAVGTMSQDKDVKTKYTVTLTTPLSEGLAALAVSENAVTDLSGEQNRAYAKVIEFKADKTAPKLVSSEVKKVDGVEKLILTFDENVTPVTTVTVLATTDRYVNDKGINVAVASAFATDTATNFALYEAKDGKSKSVALDITALAKGTYTKKLPGVVQDLGSTPNAYTEAKEITFARDANAYTTKPAVNTLTIVNNDTITVAFSQELSDTALNAANYNMGGVAVKSVEFYGDKTTVQIKLVSGANTVSGDRTIRITSVTNSSGIAMDSYSTVRAMKENVKPTFSATLVAADVIKVEFTEAIASGTPGVGVAQALTGSNFVVKADNVTATVSAVNTLVSGTPVVADTGYKVMYLKLSAPISDLAKPLTVSATGIVDVTKTGTILVADVVGNAVVTTTFDVAK